MTANTTTHAARRASGGAGAATRGVPTDPRSVLEPSPTEQFQASVRRLLATLLDRAFGIALEQVERLAQTFDDIAARGGLQLNAVLGGVRATLEGRNLIWGAITGAVSALSPAAKVALATALILALLLLPVTVVLLLLALIIGVVAAALARAGSTGG